MSNSFQSQWDQFYPNKLPISHYLVQYFQQSWFRIHSLPESKRYADTPAEYELLLNRHNQIITDCFRENTSIFIVSGHYFSRSRNNKAYDPAFILPYKFHLEQEINLTQANEHNDLLKKIADDEVRAFMISFEQNIILAPYDGGIDFIIFDKTKRNALRDKYKDWLSPREDGL